MLAAQRLKQKKKLTCPNGRVVSEAKLMCQKVISYVQSASQFWDWHLKVNTYLKQWDS